MFEKNVVPLAFSLLNVMIIWSPMHETFKDIFQYIPLAKLHTDLFYRQWLKGNNFKSLALYFFEKFWKPEKKVFCNDPLVDYF